MSILSCKAEDTGLVKAEGKRGKWMAEGTKLGWKLGEEMEGVCVCVDTREEEKHEMVLTPYGWWLS